MNEAKISTADKPKISRVEVYWHTVKYRTVILYAIVIAAIVLSLTYLVFPEVSGKVLQKLSDEVAPRDAGLATQPAGRQARFVNLDGKVQIKKVNSVEWVSAD